MHKHTRNLFLAGLLLGLALAVGGIVQAAPGLSIAGSKAAETFGRESSLAGSKGLETFGRESSFAQHNTGADWLVAGSMADKILGRESS